MPKLPWTNSSASMHELRAHLASYLDTLRRENASAHTIRNYGSDLEAFLGYLAPPGSELPAARDLDVLAIREWLANLYEKEFAPASMRRKLAAVRAFLKHLQRIGVLDVNVAKFVRTPKLPQALPAVLSPEQTNDLIDLAPSKGEELARPHVRRDVALLELLYGCGVRVSEAVGLNMQDLDIRDRWILVRGKGRKERQVPFGTRAAEAIDRYLPERQPIQGERALFLNHRGTRLTDRSVRHIVKFYARWILRDPSVHPHGFRHAYATHMLAEGADLRSIQELLGHANLSTTQKYTQLSLADLMRVYDRTHPKA